MESLEKYEKLIFKEAHYCFKRLPIPRQVFFEDLVSEATLVYYKAMDSFDTDKYDNKFITFFTVVLRNFFKKEVTKAYKRKFITISEDYDVVDKPRKNTFRKVNTSTLSPAAKRIWNQIMESDSEYRQELLNRKGSLNCPRLSLLFKSAKIKNSCGPRVLAELRLVLTTFNVI